MGGRGVMNSDENRNIILNFVNGCILLGISKENICNVIEIPIRTVNRWLKKPKGDGRRFNDRKAANSLSDKEIERIIKICTQKRFMDKNPHEIVSILADEGQYYGSESTFYRLLRRFNLLNHRSNSKPGKKVAKPRELKAFGPNQVWSWDITYLRTNIKGKFLYLYMIVDIWSRAIVEWAVHESEDGIYASELVSRASIKTNTKYIFLHSDNGSPMKSANMLSTLQKLEIIPSYSRPSVSNDNPYSESLFKTLKYVPSYPSLFRSIDEAKLWVEEFVTWYNFEHRHSSINYVTPMDRYNLLDQEILAKRKQVYLAAREKNPERWSGKIKKNEWQAEVILNPSENYEKVTMELAS